MTGGRAEAEPGRKKAVPLSCLDAQRRRRRGKSVKVKGEKEGERGEDAFLQGLHRALHPPGQSTEQKGEDKQGEKPELKYSLQGRSKTSLDKCHACRHSQVAPYSRPHDGGHSINLIISLSPSVLFRFSPPGSCNSCAFSHHGGAVPEGAPVGRRRPRLRPAALAVVQHRQEGGQDARASGEGEGGRGNSLHTCHVVYVSARSSQNQYLLNSHDRSPNLNYSLFLFSPPA